MAERLKRVPLWYEAASAVTIASLVACQLGKKLGFVTPSPEGTKTGSTETVPPPTSTLEATSPANIQPMVEETPVSGATATPETTSPAVWAPPTLEQMAVTGYGGELSPDVVVYEFDKVIATGLARVGIENTKVNFSDNGLSGNDYFWAPLVTDSEGSVIWVYDPAIGQLEWPVKLDIVYDAQGLPFYSLHTEGLSYQAVPDSESAQIVWGGTKDGISGKYLAILAKDPITLPDGRQIYSTFWDRSSQSWLPTPGLAELLATPTPEVPPPYEIVEGYREEIRKEVLGVPVSVDIITDTSLQERALGPVQKIVLNNNFNGPEHAVAEGTMRALFLAWQSASDERMGVSFEQYMAMVKEYTEGSRPFEDIGVEIWANDLQTGALDPKPTIFDPTEPVRVVYVEKHQLQENMGFESFKAWGVHKDIDGRLEVWIHFPLYFVDSANWITSLYSTILYVQAVDLLRLDDSWANRQSGGHPEPNQELQDSLIYQPDLNRAGVGALKISP